uniref:Uncharacterized protein n=1 Tax=Mycena chlorophos TaxID=658473 RepID=A0ABQ0M5B4_MYCCL|nr:predicted protein [Mycena chlorophos]
MQNKHGLLFNSYVRLFQGQQRICSAQSSASSGPALKSGSQTLNPRLFSSMISSSSSAALLLLLAPGSPRFSVAGRLSHLAASRSSPKFFSSSTSTTEEQELQSRAPKSSLLARPRRSSLRQEVNSVKYASIDEVLASHDSSNGVIELRPLDIFHRGLGAGHGFTFSVPVVPINLSRSSSSKYCDIQTPEASSSRPTLSRTNSVTDTVRRLAENPLAAPELPSAAMFGDRDEFEVMPDLQWPQRELFTIREISRDGLSLSRSSVTASATAIQPTQKEGQPQLQTPMSPSALLAAQSLLKEDRKFRKKEGFGDVPLSSAVQRLAEQVRAEEERVNMAKKERRGSKSWSMFF